MNILKALIEIHISYVKKSEERTNNRIGKVKSLIFFTESHEHNKESDRICLLHLTFLGTIIDIGSMRSLLACSLKNLTISHLVVSTPRLHITPKIKQTVNNTDSVKNLIYILK